MPDELFFIRDTRAVVGNCAMWWRPNGGGYTCNVREAWMLDRAAAEALGLRDTDELVPAEPVLRLAELHFDVQLLPRVRNVSKPKTALPREKLRGNIEA